MQYASIDTKISLTNLAHHQMHRMHLVHVQNLYEITTLQTKRTLWLINVDLKEYTFLYTTHHILYLQR